MPSRGREHEMGISLSPSMRDHRHYHRSRSNREGRCKASMVIATDLHQPGAAEAYREPLPRRRGAIGLSQRCVLSRRNSCSLACIVARHGLLEMPDSSTTYRLR